LVRRRPPHPRRARRRDRARPAVLQHARREPEQARMKRFPQSVCFRVTRACNARCGFCLAPWDGEHPSAEVLLHRIDWLTDRGVRVVHFCGGEPTIHPALGALIARTRERGATARLTTNGIAMPEPLL